LIYSLCTRSNFRGGLCTTGNPMDLLTLVGNFGGSSGAGCSGALRSAQRLCFSSGDALAVGWLASSEQGGAVANGI
jgi:hypothetical protein